MTDHEELRPRLIRFCRGYLGGDDDAEDAAQDVLVKLLDAPEDVERLDLWALRVARNHCLRRLRDRGRRAVTPLATDFDLAASLSGEATRADRRENARRVAEALGDLPDEQREALRLRYLENLSREEIAGILEVPASTVKSRLFEGLKRLRTLVPPP